MTMNQKEKERLTAELLRLPERFDQFASHVTAFIEWQPEFNSRQEQFIASQRASNSDIARQLQKLTDEMGDLLGHVPGRVARRSPTTSRRCWVSR